MFASLTMLDRFAAGITLRSRFARHSPVLPPAPLARVEERDRGLTEVRWELVWSYREIQADADHGPAVLGLCLDQDAGELAFVDPDVVWPLDRALDSWCELLCCLTDREWDGEGEEQVAFVEGSQDR